jgi:hypothetical protein
MKTTNIPYGLAALTGIATGNVGMAFTNPTPRGTNELFSLQVTGYVTTAKNNGYSASLDWPIGFQAATSTAPGSAGYVTWAKSSGATYSVFLAGAGTDPSPYIAIPISTNWPGIYQPPWAVSQYPNQLLLKINASSTLVPSGSLVTAYLSFIIWSVNGTKACQGVTVTGAPSLSLGKFDGATGFQPVPSEFIFNNECTFTPRAIDKLIDVQPSFNGGSSLMFSTLLLDQFYWGPTINQKLIMTWYVSNTLVLTATATMNEVGYVPQNTQLIFTWDPTGKILVTNQTPTLNSVAALKATFDFSAALSAQGVDPITGILIMSIQPDASTGVSIYPNDLTPPPPFNLGGTGLCTTSAESIWYTPGATPGTKVTLAGPVTPAFGDGVSLASVIVQYVPYNDFDGATNSKSVTIPPILNLRLPAGTSIQYRAYVDTTKTHFVVETPDGNVYHTPFNSVMTERIGYKNQWGYYYVNPGTEHDSFPCMSGTSTTTAPSPEPPYQPTPTPGPGPTPGPTPSDDTALLVLGGVVSLGALFFLARQ